MNDRDIPRGARSARRAGRAIEALGWACALSVLCVAVADAQPDAREVASKLAPAILQRLEAPETESVVWVEFGDRGERDEGERTRALAEAQARLTPRARARRLRAHVFPLVDERDLPVSPDYLAALEAEGFRPFAVSRWFNRAAVRVRGADLPRLAARPGVVRLSPLERAVRSADPAPDESSDFVTPLRSERGESVALDGQLAGALLQIGVPALHDSSYRGEGVLVAVLDEGYNRWDRHEALLNTLVPPGHTRDFVQGDTTVTDTTSGLFTHGTWVLGCLAGNAPGRYVGAAPGATYALARTENSASELPVEMTNWALAMEWADSLGADLISSSVGYTTFDVSPPAYTYADLDGHTTEITRAAEIAAEKGILVVNSVGNEGNKPWHYLVAPADVHGDSLISVGAVDAFDQAGAFSSFGPSADGRVKPDLVARGVSVPLPATTGAPDAYTVQNGTSFATPMVAGLAACLLQARPAWTPQEVIRALRETASRASNPNNQLGYGVPNGGSALCWTPEGGVAGGLSPGSVTLTGPNPMPLGSAGMTAIFAAAGVEGGPNHGDIRVHDVMGRALRTLWSGDIARGQCVTVRWTGEDDEGRRVRPGVYYLSLDAGGDVSAARVVVLD